MVMNVKEQVEWLAVETTVLEENLPWCRFDHHKFHMAWSGWNPGRHGAKPATNGLSYGTAVFPR
jgi:hypothetical protein